MTQIVHIGNIDFEFECASKSLKPLDTSGYSNVLCLQLQFLPILYARPCDVVAVTDYPSQEYLDFLEQTGWFPEGLPRLALLREYTSFQGKQCAFWGPSQRVQKWALQRDMDCVMPSWDLVRQVNSKAFSFLYRIFPEAALLANESELSTWLQKTIGEKVLKTCFGVSGQGNLCLSNSYSFPDILNFCRKEWQAKRFVIGEPWVERVCDFSTQWLIHPNRYIEPIGATRFETSEQGQYQGTMAGPEELLFADMIPFLQEHRREALKALNDMAAMGCFGYVGVDALVYRDRETHSFKLYPVVEINGRRTLSLVALQMQQRISPEHILQMQLHQGKNPEQSLLPSQLMNSKQKQVVFHRYLTITRHSYTGCLV
ncbi:MAG: hypothetical protein WCK42_09650 [Myxococcaceae bacterium]